MFERLTNTSNELFGRQQLKQTFIDDDVLTYHMIHRCEKRISGMADLNETFGYQIFTGQRHPSRTKVLQIAFAMALSVRETNRALTAAGVARLDPKCRRDAIILFCIDRARSLQKVNEELYRLGEDTIC